MRPGTRESYEERVLRVLVFIQERLDEDLSLERLARVASFSAFHFHRIFRGLVGESLKQHVRRLRLERAAFRLIHADGPVTPMAFDAGYQSHEAFTRAFRLRFGRSPEAFRKEHRDAWQAEAPSGVHYVPKDCKLEFTPLRSDSEPLELTIERHDRRRAVFVRHVGPYLQCLGAWRELVDWAEARGVAPEGRMAGICHDDPAVTDACHLRYDACLIADDSIRPEGSVGEQVLFGGEFAVFAHRGPHEGLASIYEDLMGQWLPGSGRELRDLPCIEVYRTGPFQVSDAEEYRTDIYVPLASLAG